MTAVLLFAVCTEAIAATSSSCQSIFVENVSEHADPVAWAMSEFTEPVSFDENNFRFSVHMLGASARGIGRTAEYVSGVTDGREMLSYSIIDSDYTNSYGTAGFIIEVPSENILAANYRDMGSNAGMPAVTKALNENDGIPSPSQILNSSKIRNPSGWNEVVAFRKGPHGRRIRVVGVLYVSSTGQSINFDSEQKALVTWAHQKGLPVVFVKAKRWR